MAQGEVTSEEQSQLIASSSPPGAATPPPQTPIVLWSYFRVLWPAYLIAGLYCFCVEFISLFSPIPLAIALDVILCAVLLGIAGASLYFQYAAVFDVVCAGGRIPERLTFAPVWWPEMVRGRCIHILGLIFGRRVILADQSDATTQYNPLLEGYQSIPSGPPEAHSAPP